MPGPGRRRGPRLSTLEWRRASRAREHPDGRWSRDLARPARLPTRLEVQLLLDVIWPPHQDLGDSARTRHTPQRDSPPSAPSARRPSRSRAPSGRGFRSRSTSRPVSALGKQSAGAGCCARWRSTKRVDRPPPPVMTFGVEWTTPRDARRSSSAVADGSNTPVTFQARILLEKLSMTPWT